MTVTTPSSRFLLPYLITSLQELGPSGKTMSSRKEKNVPSPFPLEQPRLSESFFLQGGERVREVSRVSRVTSRRGPGPPRSPSCQNSRPSPFRVACPLLRPRLGFGDSAYFMYYCPDCCCAAAQSYLTLCDPMNCSMPGFPVLHHLPEFPQAHVH